jgi:hypothetical protein
MYPVIEEKVALDAASASMECLIPYLDLETKVNQPFDPLAHRQGTEDHLGANG